MKKIIDIDMDGLHKSSRRLAAIISRKGYKPDHILYIERAGLFIGKELADIFECTITGVYASRTGGGIKERLKMVLRYLPRRITHFLRQIEIRSNVHGVKSFRKVAIEGPYPLRGKKILIVDDAIDTGNSINSVQAFLEKEGYAAEDIKVAALTVTGESVRDKADFYLFEQVCAFPWSYDSREYDQAWKVYSSMKMQINDMQKS